MNKIQVQLLSLGTLGFLIELKHITILHEFKYFQKR